MQGAIYRSDGNISQLRDEVNSAPVFFHPLPIVRRDIILA